jgi:hypothetical protein
MIFRDIVILPVGCWLPTEWPNSPSGANALDAHKARIEHFRRDDVVKVDCAACHHVALLTPDFLMRLGLNPRSQSVQPETVGALGACVSPSELGRKVNDL